MNYRHNTRCNFIVIFVNVKKLKKINSIRIVKEKAFTQMTIREKTKNVKLRNKNKNI